MYFSNNSLSSRIDMYNSVLSDLYVILNKDTEHTDEEIQIEIEKFVFNQFYQWNSNKPSNIVLSINLDKLTPKFKDIILDAMKSLTVYLQNLKDNVNTKGFKVKASSKETQLFNQKLMRMLKFVNINDIKNYVISYYLRMVTDKDKSIDFDDDYGSENVYLASVVVNIGKNITKMYYRELYKSYLETVSDENNKMSYSDWFNELSDDEKFSDEYETKFYVFLGGKIVEILCALSLVSTNVIKRSAKEKVYIIEIPEHIKSILDENNKIYSVPPKLPMIVPPKPYSPNELGGFFLNDSQEKNPLLIHKASYKCKSIIKDDIIYNMVNNIAFIPYKVNKQLLYYLVDKGEQYKILMSKDIIDNYENIVNKTTYIINKIKGLKSEYLLQENILKIAALYQNRKIYFPVRIDQRGRLYCEPHYFNYQGVELAKALLLFANPGIIRRNDEQAIEYLKIYGANCFGLDKSSHKKRIEWVDSNVEDIINYDNGKLIEKAKSKVLFLAFCMEFSRFYQFMCDESLWEFKTYLPIQLDATCNGYQHMAMLTLDHNLVKQLNLTTSTWDDTPKDFYGLIAANLIEHIKHKLSTALSINDREIYERLSKLAIQRKIVKKPIMTLGYNVSRPKMIEYLKEHFECDTKDKNWYKLKDDPTIKLKNSDFVIMARDIISVLTKLFPKLPDLINYLKEVAKICTNLGLYIPWTLPTGVTVKQGYLASDEVRLQPFTYSKKL